MNKIKQENVNKIVEEFKKFVLRFKREPARQCQIDAIRALFSGHHPHFLFDLCCGAGKTIIEAFLVYKELIDSKTKNKYARVMIASHRLLLNNQLVDIVNAALTANKITNVKWFNLSSATIKINGIVAAPFKKTSINTIRSCQDHVIIIACAASEKKHFKKNKSYITVMRWKCR